MQGVGKSIADKVRLLETAPQPETPRLNPVASPQIEEILESGELQKAKYLTETEEARTINLFANIWGACQSTQLSTAAPALIHSPLR